MIEQGIVRLVNADAGVTAIASVGGFADELPKDPTLPSWYYKIITTKSEYTLQGEGTTRIWLEINCCASQPADAVKLGKAIDAVLQNFSGTLPDDDGTVVDSCLRDDRDTFFDSDARIWRRRIEYYVWFYEQS